MEKCILLLMSSMHFFMLANWGELFYMIAVQSNE